MTQLGRTGIDGFPLELGGSTFGWTSDETTSHSGERLGELCS
jgi:hypothetical protein